MIKMRAKTYSSYTKCGGCNEERYTFYSICGPIKKINGIPTGLCGSCMCDWIVEEEMDVHQFIRGR